MTQQNYIERIQAGAISSRESTCGWSSTEGHKNCTVTTYTLAMVMTNGSDKAHRMTFALHSGDGKLYGSAGPGCGSKQNGYNWAAYGQIRPAVTCGRCR